MILAILVGKIILILSRALRVGGGSAAPGLYALKIYPQLINKLILKVPQNVVITGTNGKTTTARMLAHFAQSRGHRVIRNATGSNLERGIASTLISHSSLHLGGVKLKKVDLGVWELDEAAFNSVAFQIKPQLIIFLNVFRDQLDRYGEVDNVVKHWCDTLSQLDHQTMVLINGDDANIARLANCFKGKVETFGVAGFTISDEAIKAKSGSKKLDFEAYKVKSQDISGTIFQFQPKAGPPVAETINLPLPGIYHIYDFLAAFVAGLHLNFDPPVMIGLLKNYSPAFGRVEKIEFPHSKWEGKSTGYIFLIKNPAGATQVFETIAPELKSDDHLLLALNDNLADGTDVSWIWDVNFEILQNSSRAKSRDYKIFVSGTRAQELAVRLKYAGFNPKQIKIENQLKRALEQAKHALNGQLFILPTYTAMLELQRILTKMGIKKHYWKEEGL